MMPSAPTETTTPSKSGCPRSKRRNSPSAVTSSIAVTTVANPPLVDPEPWVPVATAPATVTCGSDGRLWSAQPRPWSQGPRSAYRTPDSIVTVRFASSSGPIPVSWSVATSTPSVSAIALKLCPAPSAFIRDPRAFRTVSHKPPTSSGATDDDDANETFPAQFRGRASVVMAEQ